MTLAKLVILNSSTAALSPSHTVILGTFAESALSEPNVLSANTAKDLVLPRVHSAKSLRTGSVKDLSQDDPLPVC
jgi:hypothetical protein